MSTNKPVIGITLSSQEHPSWLHFAEAVRAALGEPKPLVANDPHNVLTGELQGIILGGGGDIHPQFFNAAEEIPPRDLCLCRDEFELDLCREAISRNIPLLGVCRGLQVLVVAAGGTLYQHLPNNIAGALRHETDGKGPAEHMVKLLPGSKLAEICEVDSLMVNSTHHQAAKELNGGLVAIAFSGDGIIEAVELPSASFILAVQWHPERMLDSQPAQGKLFEKLVKAASL